MKAIQYHWELDAYKMSAKAGMAVFHCSKQFPREEKFSLTDQIRRSSRSVFAQIAEAWRKRKYEAAFISKLNDAEAEAAETQVWIEYAVKCDYLNRDSGKQLHRDYDNLIGKLVTIANRPKLWLVRKSKA